MKPEQYQIGIDTFDRMEANCTLEERLAFAKGNIDKYTWRNKGQDRKDFEKIIAYAKWALKQINKEEINPIIDNPPYAKDEMQRTTLRVGFSEQTIV